MKLPETKKERIQYLALAIIGVVAIGYGVMLGVGAMSAKKAQQQEELDEKQQELEKRERLMERVRVAKPRQAEIVAEVRAETSRYFPEYVFESPFLTMKGLVTGTASNAVFNVEKVNETGRAKLRPRQGDKTSGSFALYSIQVNGSGGLKSVIDLLKVLESGNPYAQVQGLTVRARQPSPLKHGVGFRLSVPVWADDSKARRFADAGKTD